MSDGERESFNNLLNAYHEGKISRALVESFGRSISLRLWTETLERYRTRTLAEIVIAEVLDDIDAARTTKRELPA